MGEIDEDRLIAKVILFSYLTSLATVMWYELVGVEWMVIIVLMFIILKIRRLYGSK